LEHLPVVEVTMVKKIDGKARTIFGEADSKIDMGTICPPAQEAEKEGGEN
jgi:hypothetical protein